MGVKGLWQLLDTTGKPVTLESLEGKILAVDISIWLNQAVKGMRDHHGNQVHNAHLISLYHRVCKLLYYRIRPVFVFDGGVPQLKKHTLMARRQQKHQAAATSEKTAERVLQTVLKHHALSAVIAGESDLSVPQGLVAATANHARTKKDDIFHLAPLDKNISQDGTTLKMDEIDYSWEARMEQRHEIFSRYSNIMDIDTESVEFRSLPVDIQYEILTEIRERRKETKWAALSELPEESDDFAKYQMSKLLKMGRVGRSLDVVKKQLNAPDVDELDKVLKGHIQLTGDIESRRVIAEEESHYVLIRGTHNIEKARRERRKKSTEDADVDEKEIIEIESDDEDIVDALRRKLKQQKENQLQGIQVKSEFCDDVDIDDTPNTSNGKALINNSANNIGESAVPEIKIKTEPPDIQADDNVNRTLRTAQTDDPLSSKELENNPVASTSAATHGNSVEGGFITEMNGEDPLLDGHNQLSTSDKQTEPSHTIDYGDFMLDSEGSDDELMTLEEALNDTDIIQENDTAKIQENDTALTPENDTAKIQDNDTATIEETDAATIEETDTTKIQETEQAVVSSAHRSTKPSEVTLNLPASDTTGVDVQLSDNDSDNETSAVAEMPDEDSDYSSGTEATEKNTKSGKSDESRSLENSAKNVQHKNILSNGSSGLQQAMDSCLTQRRQKLLASLRSTIADAQESDVPNEDNTITSEVQQCSTSDRDGDLEQLNVVKVKEEKVDDIFTELQKKQNQDISVMRTDSESESLEADVMLEVGADIDFSMEGGFIKEESCSDDEDNDQIGISESAEEITDQDVNGPDSPHATVDHLAAKFLQESDDRNEFTDMTQNELSDMRDKLSVQRKQLLKERGQQERVAATITDNMYIEAQDLLELFGVPYLTAPMEAEAQCAELDMLDLTHGTITDDSDIWLFGGKRVYKNFFNQEKYVEYFNQQNIEDKLLLDRPKLINLALLCGSDYTEGVSGVGTVSAVEMLAEFPGEALEPLKQIKRWSSSLHVSPSPVRRRVRKLKFSEGFPSQAVVDAYLNPDVDHSTENFSWADPNLDALRAFAHQKFGWLRDKCDETLVPMWNKCTQNKAQRTINTYFNTEIESAPRIKSKRVQGVLDHLRGVTHSTVLPSVESTSKNVSDILSVSSNDMEASTSGAANKRTKGPKKSAKKSTSTSTVAQPTKRVTRKTIEYSKNTKPMSDYFEPEQVETKNMPVKSTRGGRGKTRKGRGQALKGQSQVQKRRGQTAASVAIATPRHIPEHQEINLSESSSSESD